LIQVKDGVARAVVVQGQEFVSFFADQVEPGSSILASVVNVDNGRLALYQDGGIAAFLSVSGLAFQPGETGIYRIDPDQAPAPIQLSSQPFATSAANAGSLFSARQTNAIGDLAFEMLGGVAIVSGGTRVLLGEQGTPLDPADPARGSFRGSLIGFALNDLGQVAFSAEVVDSGGTFREAVFFYDPSLGLRELAREGETVGGIPLAGVGQVRINGAEGATFTLPEADSLGDDGTVAFIARAASGSDIVFTWRPPSPACSPADVTTTGATLAGQPGFGVPDGVADPDDLGYYLGFWLVSDAAVADMTTSGATLAGQPGFGVPDGVVDLDDLGFFLNVWSQGCP